MGRPESRGEHTPDLSKLPAAAQEALILKLAAKVSRLERLVSDLCDENLRLKGLKGRPQIKPSGMESATTAKPTSERDKRRGPGKLDTECRGRR